MNETKSPSRPPRVRGKIPGRIPLPSERIPVWSLVLLGVAALSLILLGIARASAPFADFYNRTFGAAFRAVFAFLTNLIPFSFAELLVLLIPLALFLLIFYGIKYRSQTVRSVLAYIVILLSGVSFLFSTFVLNHGIGYHTTELGDRISLANDPVYVTELAETAEKLIDEIHIHLPLIEYERSGASNMPYSLTHMNDKLMDAYDSLAAKYDFIQNPNSRVKPVMLSELMSYSHFTGFYTFFTGEANINIDFPDYTLPYTAAHELAHQRGIARENEANFVAFLACMESPDCYIRYCGLVNMYEYVANALYSADNSPGKTRYYEVTSKLDPRIRGEMNAYSEFFSKYRHSAISNVTTSINDSFLKANGNEEGSKSYGLVVNLAVSYYKER